LYEEIDNYKAFSESFVLDAKTETISKILEEDEEIKDLHEQMVPEEITYEEFWCRYFFREQQDIEHHKQQEERVALQKKKAEEAASLAAVRKAQLEEKVAAKLMEDSSNGDDFESKISIPATGSSESKWKEKVQELQAKLASMEENSQLEKARISQEMEAKYQSLCDSYENRMAQMTIQIDNSRAAGYDDGIRESEQIIDSIRKSTEKEIEALQQQLALAHQQPSQQQQVEASSTGDDPTILSKLQQENESLSKSLSEKQAKIVELQKKLQQDTEQLKSTYEEKVKLEVELKVLKESFDEKRSKQFEELAVSKKSVLELEAQLKSNIGSSDSTSPATVELSKQLEQMKGEAEIWRVRALKMKKAKEMVDEELRESKAAQEKQAEEIVALQTSQSSSSNDDQVAELQSSIGVLKAHLNELNEQKQTSENNLKSQISAMEQKLEQAALQVEVSYMKGIEEARVTIEAEKQKAFEEGVAKSKEQVQALQSEREALEASYAEELKSSKDAINRLQAEVAELR
jgi:DNA repair exonuclease SbcCD ATPase subunit